MGTYDELVARKADEIIVAFMKLSLGKRVGLFSCSVYRRLKNHKNFDAMRRLIIDYLEQYNGDFSSPDKLLELSKFRIQLLNLYNDEGIDE